MIAELGRFALEFLKLAPRYFVAVSVITGALLFLPVSWLARLGLNEFADAHLPWLGLAFLVSAALWGVATVNSVWGWGRRLLARRRREQRIIDRVNNLTEDEKQILRFYFANNTRSNKLRIDDGVVQGLVAEGIIYRSASMGNVVEGLAHNITDLVWDYIHLHPEVLEGTTKTHRTDKHHRGW